jgi:predicted GTPase
MDIINLSDQIEDVVVKNDLTDTASILKNEYAIAKSVDLKKTLEAMEDENRVLKLGILGRVKAGKSSLLNALVFDGEDVLPKAATPMTAALTVLQYGDTTKAEVDFFTQEDIDDIKQIANRYEAKLNNVKISEYEKLKKVRLRKEKLDNLSSEQEQEVKEKALINAQRELKKDDNLSSSYDQYQKIKSSGVAVDELEQYKSIEAKDIMELNSKLFDFVGSSGKYMPFTKSVTMTIQKESLKDIQIIDTPGVNDPVVSREERTRELLKDCDVVLVVSPSGQFLSSEDLELMDRITSKEGIKELYLVASQVDNQLYGSEKESILNSALTKIETKLTSQQNDVLKSLKSSNLEVGSTYDNLIENRVIASSGICYNMFKNFDTQNDWDANMKKVWENLNLHYKDFFSDKDTAIASLKKLANIESIENIISDVREKKDTILAKRKAEYTKAKHKSLVEYKTSLEQDIKEQIKRVETSDINELKKQRDEIEKFKSKAIFTTNDVYSDMVEELEFDIKTKLQDELNSSFRQSKRDIQESEGIETETWKHDKKKGWWDVYIFEDRYEQRIRTFTTVKAGLIRNSLENLTDDVEITIDVEAKQYVANWRKKIYKELVSTLRSQAGDDILDVMLISKTIRSILSSVVFPDISYNGNFPIALKKSGTLKESEAKQFINEAHNYISDLKSRVHQDIHDYVGSLISTLKQENVGESIFLKYTKEIEQLENDIENKELTLDRLNDILQQLGAIGE